VWDKKGADEITGATFTTFSAAQSRSCNNQHNACADIANKSVCVHLSSSPLPLNLRLRNKERVLMRDVNNRQQTIPTMSRQHNVMPSKVRSPSSLFLSGRLLCAA
jgi:hypothetical protein